MLKRSSFTLFELLLAVAIVGLLLGVSLPRLSGSLRKVSFEAQLRKIGLFFDYAKTRALLANVAVQVEVDRAKRTIVLKDAGSNRSLLRPLVIQPGFELYSRPDSFLFYPDGKAQEFLCALSDGRQMKDGFYSDGVSRGIRAIKQPGLGK